MQLKWFSPHFNRFNCKFQLWPFVWRNGSSHPASQIKTGLPPAAQILCWLLPSLQRHKNNKLMWGGGLFEVAGGNWGRLRAPQQHRQPPVEPPTPDSTDLKNSANLVLTSTLSRSSTVRTPDLRTSWTPQRNSTKTIATFSKGPLLLFTSSFWVWAAPSTTLTFWSLSKNWVSILKELRSFPASFMCTLWTLLLNLSISGVPFPVLLSTLIRSRFQAKPATLLIPIEFSFPFRGGGALRYSVPKWLLFLNYCGEWYSLPAYFFFSFLLRSVANFLPVLFLFETWILITLRKSYFSIINVDPNTSLDQPEIDCSWFNQTNIIGPTSIYRQESQPRFWLN